MVVSVCELNPCPLRERDGSQPLAHSCCVELVREREARVVAENERDVFRAALREAVSLLAWIASR